MKKIYVNNYQTGEWVIFKGQMKRRGVNWENVFIVAVFIIAAIAFYIPAILYWFNLRTY